MKTLWDQPGGVLFCWWCFFFQSQKESTEAFTWQVTRGQLRVAIPKALCTSGCRWVLRAAAHSPVHSSGSSCRSQSHLFPVHSSTMTYLCMKRRTKTCLSEYARKGSTEPHQHVKLCCSLGCSQPAEGHPLFELPFSNSS